MPPVLLCVKLPVFLYYKGIEFEHIPVNPLDPQASIAHTNGDQVPVLEIDGEWRRESSSHALWLDKIFPDKPLCPQQHRKKILAIDQWISHQFLTSAFRPAIDTDEPPVPLPSMAFSRYCKRTYTSTRRDTPSLAKAFKASAVYPRHG